MTSPLKGRPNPKSRHIVEGLSKEEIARRWEARLAEKSHFNEKGCRIWTGGLNTLGYGQTSAFGRLMMVHRFTYEITYDMKIHPKLVVCHTCDTPACCNPEHLWIGTEKQNMRDAADKKRWKQRQGSQCKRGHLYVDGSYYVKTQRGRPARVCLECERLRMKSPEYIEWRRNYQRRRRAEKRASSV